MRPESAHDCYGAAHAGTALSAALGICAARDQRGTDENVVAIFGDAALTNGNSFEAMNNIANTTKKFIGILNDNEWSIAKNVGAISGYLNKLITHPSYNKLAKDFERFMRRLPKGELALKLAHKAEEGFKGALTEVGLKPSPSTMESDGRGGYGNSLIFEEMGFRYFGPLDGQTGPQGGAPRGRRSGRHATRGLPIRRQAGDLCRRRDVPGVTLIGLPVGRAWVYD